MTLSNYTREIADTICTRMSEGESLRAICRDHGMPSEGTVRGWAVRNHDSFGERYAAARLLLMDYWADQIVDIADDGELDPRDRQIRAGVRQWIMSKVAPRRYGERLLHAGDPDSPIQHFHKQVNLAELSPDALDALEHFLLHVVDSRAVMGDGMLVEHDPAHANTQHEVVQRPTALLDGRSQ